MVDVGSRRAEPVAPADAKRRPSSFEGDDGAPGRAQLDARDVVDPVRHERAVTVGVRASQELHFQRAPDHECPLPFDAHVGRPFGRDGVGAEGEAVLERPDLHGAANARRIEPSRVALLDLAQSRGHLELAEKDIHGRRVRRVVTRRRHRPPPPELEAGECDAPGPAEVPSRSRTRVSAP